MSKSRSIFEEVDSSKSEAKTEIAIRKRRVYPRGAIAVWISVLFVLAFAMIVVGGLTRLTESGLSITEWKPVTGVVPPMNEADWAGEFEKYQQIPQFELLNPEMTVEEFKSIYWWEWSHRVLGRLVGLVWVVGFVGFLATRNIPPGWTGRLLGLGILGGIQGFIGWWMVASGLGSGMVSVAPYRLAVHLGLAFAILGLIAWYVMTLRRSEQDLLQARRQRSEVLMRWGGILVFFAFFQILLGALVAGNDAGRGYIDWPLIGGRILPEDAFEIAPWWKNFVETQILVQFNHRIGGYVLAILGAVAWIRSRKSGQVHVRRAFDAMAVALIAQIVLGIYTLVNASPWQIAILHQAGAVVLFVLVIRARFAAFYPKSQRIARS